MNERKYQRNQEILRLREQGLSIRRLYKVGCKINCRSRACPCNEFMPLSLILALTLTLKDYPNLPAFGETFTKKLGDCLRAEAPFLLNVRE